MGHTTNDFFAAIDPVVNREYYGLENEDVPEKQFSQFFKVSSDDEPQMSSVEYGGPSSLTLKAENSAVAPKFIVQGAVKTYLTSTYAGAITISYEAARDVKNRYGKIQQAASALGEAERVTPELLTALFMDGTFSTSSYTVADGAAVCGTHTLPDGITTTSNQLATAAALDETSAEDVRVALKAIKAPSTNIRPLKMKAWIIPSAYEPIAMKLASSQKTIGSANNDPSIVKGTQVKVFDYLPSTTKWWAETSADSRGLFWHWIEKPTFITDQVVLMLQKVYVSFFRSRYGIVDFRHLFGSNAT